MPLKLNVGLAKKLGMPDYGSLGASCHVEVELDHALLEHDLNGFQERVREAFAACRDAVHDELTRNQSANGRPAAAAPAPDGSATMTHCANSSNGSSSHRASQKQLDYVAQLAGQIRGLGVRKLESLAERMFSKPLADLSSLDASGLIDVLKELKSGKIELASAMNGAAA